MTYAERVNRWNQWYDQAPDDWRFQFILWPLLALGAINLILTIWVGFPFALLVVLGIIFIAAVRVPYTLGWVATEGHAVPDAAGSPKFQIDGAGWIVDLNRRYDALPETRRFWIYPAVLLIAGAINMALTISVGFPFGLLFLLALLALVVIRAPYAAGWYKPAPVLGEAIPANHVEHEPVAAIGSEAAAPPAEGPPVAMHRPDETEYPRED